MRSRWAGAELPENAATSQTRRNPQESRGSIGGKSYRNSDFRRGTSHSVDRQISVATMMDRTDDL
jgi:hypothetical protein